MQITVGLCWNFKTIAFISRNKCNGNAAFVGPVENWQLVQVLPVDSMSSILPTTNSLFTLSWRRSRVVRTHWTATSFRFSQVFSSQTSVPERRVSVSHLPAAAADYFHSGHRVPAVDSRPSVYSASAPAGEPSQKHRGASTRTDANWCEMSTAAAARAKSESSKCK